jgi:hypothetical protein
LCPLNSSAAFLTVPQNQIFHCREPVTVQTALDHRQTHYLGAADCTCFFLHKVWYCQKQNNHLTLHDATVRPDY